MLPGVRRECRARQVQERPDDPGFSVQSGEAARTGIAENAHEYRLDLIIEGVGGNDLGVALGRDLFEKLPSSTTPLFFSLTDSGCATTDTKKPEAKGMTRNERCRPASRPASTVIECRDRDLATHRHGQLCRGAKQHHGVESAANGEDGTLALAE